MVPNSSQIEDKHGEWDWEGSHFKLADELGVGNELDSWVSGTKGRGSMKIGYVRVSKQEQNEALQRDALKEAGCEKYFNDKITSFLLKTSVIHRIWYDWFVTTERLYLPGNGFSKD